MPIDDLTGELTTTTREAEKFRWLRDYQYYKPEDSIAPGTEPYIQGSTMADFVMPLYSDLSKIAKAQDPGQLTGKQLQIAAEPVIGAKRGAVGASGSVTIHTSVGGTTIYRGDEFKIGDIRYECAETKLYTDGQAVAILAIDTGPTTNQLAGAAGSWTLPRPGCVAAAVVLAQQNGSGLTGGRGAETDDQYRDRYLNALADPPGGGNDAQVRQLAENAELTGVAVQKAFTYPAIYGSGTCGVAFLMSPTVVGGSRVPTDAQIGLVMAAVSGSLPSDLYYGIRVVASTVAVAIRVTWDSSAPGWIDTVPWPSIPSGTDEVAQAIVIPSGSSPTATTFQLASRNGSYTGLIAPSIGKRIALYNSASGTFVRKTIASVSGTGPWTIVCDTSNQASDTTYVPTALTRASPWSDSLQSSATADPTKDLVKSILTYFDSLGPGEMFSTFFDPGWRQRRQPAASAAMYPSIITSAGLTDAASVAGVTTDATPIVPTLPYATPVGSPGTYVYLKQLSDLAILPI
jgi:uncharacterized phage protein gp47/JayE